MKIYLHVKIRGTVNKFSRRSIVPTPEVPGVIQSKLRSWLNHWLAEQNLTPGANWIVGDSSGRPTDSDSMGGGVGMRPGGAACAVLACCPRSRTDFDCGPLEDRDPEEVR